MSKFFIALLMFFSASNVIYYFVIRFSLSRSLYDRERDFIYFVFICQNFSIVIAYKFYDIYFLVLFFCIISSYFGFFCIRGNVR